MKRHPEEMLLSLTLLLLCHSCLVLAKMGTKMVILDSTEVCTGNMADSIYWATEEKAIIVIGRGANDRGLFHDCNIVIGAATTESRMLQLKFDAFHILDCGVVFAVNESDRSDFSSSNTLMAKIGCNHGKVEVLHSQPKHYVKIRIHKDNRFFQQYNFRINITLIDKLPETGPQTHVVIIVGIVVVSVVGIALWLLVKYLIHRTQRWQERCAERNMERAIRLYNNQESPPESDYMYTALPPQEDDSSNRRVAAPAHRNGHCHKSKNTASRGGRHRANEITFVHADGHIETFRMRDDPQEGCSGESGHTTATATPRTARDRDRDSVAGDTQNGEEDTLGDCPPSYEEALDMPTPQDPRSPLYVNLDTKKDDNHMT